MPHPIDKEELQKAGKRKRSHSDNDGKKSKNHRVVNSIGEISSGDLDSMIHRIANRRQKEIASLDATLSRQVLRRAKDLFTVDISAIALHDPIDAEAASKTIRNLVVRAFQVMSDETQTATKRRQSWESVDNLFGFLDKLQRHEDKTGTTTTATANGKKAKPNGVGTNKEQTNNISSVARFTGAASAPPRASIPSEAEKASANAATLDKNNTVSTAAATAAKASLSNTTNGTTPERSSNPPTSAAANDSNSKKSTRTLASLSSASAQTMATALNRTTNPSSIGGGTTANSTNAAIPGTATAPAASSFHGAPRVNQPPPPYQRQSSTVEQQRVQQSQQNQRKAQEANRQPSLAVVFNADSNNTAITGNNTLRSTNTTKRTSGNAATNVSHATNTDIDTRGPVSRVGVAPSTSAQAPASVTDPVDANTDAAVVSRSSSASSYTTNRPASKSVPLQTKPVNIPWNHPTHPPAINEKPIQAPVDSHLFLAADDSDHKPTLYACYQVDRPQVTLKFRQYSPTDAMKEQFMKRLHRWDPYWRVEKSLCVGLTAPINDLVWAKKYFTHTAPKFFPNTAATFKIDNLLKTVGPRIRHVPDNQAPKDGDFRVLIRMLPLDLSKQDYGGKKRADVHIWPKGTYLQIHAAPSRRTKPRPLKLAQRKQQQHDHSKWQGICYHLDVTSLLHAEYASTTTSLDASPFSTVELGCYDSELYMFSLALCQYRAPSTISTYLQHPTRFVQNHNEAVPILKRASLEEMFHRAKQKMDSNEVHVLDDDIDNPIDEGKRNGQKQPKPPQELRRINFSIQDPLTMAALKAPVRGRNCVHFSCFDLDSFLLMNRNPSGQRWKCGKCEKFVSYEDLEYCALTSDAVAKFGKKITNLQHEVELREDRTMSLAKPVRSHQERAKAKKQAVASTVEKNGNKRVAPAIDDVVELLDSDSD